jgi:hypothetical protein
MNPSYMRVKAAAGESLERFSTWIKLPLLQPPMKVDALKAVDLATRDDEWISQVAVFVYEAEGWTVFEDLSGYLSNFMASDWLQFAGPNELVFAGYNDAICYGQLIVIQNQSVVCDFLDDEEDSSENHSYFGPGWTQGSQLRSWTDAATFVDEDELFSSPDFGNLVLYGAIP